MSERYWITGVQLGMLVVIDEKKRQEIIDKIVDEQFIGNIKQDALPKEEPKGIRIKSIEPIEGTPIEYYKKFREESGVDTNVF